jgi:Ca-activated chloride channel family protein
LRQLDDVEIGLLPEDKTAIGSGLATCLTRLRDSEAESRVIVLVTDGSNNAGEIDPATATDIARAMEVRVYTIGVGRDGLVPVPRRFRDRFGRVVERLDMLESQLDEQLLEQIADRTGGEFFRATDPESLRQIFARIDELEKTEIEHHAFRRYRDLHEPVLRAAAALFAVAALVWAAGLRVAPA